MKLSFDTSGSAPDTASLSADMCRERRTHGSGILVRRYAIDLRKEIFRKSIHLCSLCIPFALSFAYYPVLIMLSCVLVFYIIAENLRMHGKTVPIFSAVTAAAARKRDENHFVLGPVTLCCGVLVTALFFSPQAAAAGIYALGAGDGFASLFGKMFGRQKIPFTGGKSVVGSLTCFIVIFLTSTAVSSNTLAGLVLGTIGMFIEMLPLKDYDNLLIPIIIASVAQFCFGL